MPVADLITDLPNVFDLTRWGFSPEKLLGEERIRVESVLGADSADEILSIVPGKQLLPVAARFAGMNEHAYVSLVVKAVHGGDPALRSLGSAVSAFLQPYLPERYCAIAPR